MSKFKIQLPSNLIRDPNFSSAALFTYAKLVQRFYIYKGKYSEFELDHRKFMYFTGIKSNKKFKEAMHELYTHKLIKNKIEQLPRKGLIKVEMDTFFNSSKKDYYFTEFPVKVLDKSVLDDIGYPGVRLLFYIRSYINKPTEFCYCSLKRMESELDMSENTIIKYCDLLDKKKLIRKEKHKLGSTGAYEVDEFGNDKEEFTKFNNHYQLRLDKLHEYD